MRLTILFLAAVVLLATPLRSQSTDPADLYLQAQAQKAQPPSVTVDAQDVFVWFDEVPSVGTKLLRVTVTARAYDNVLLLLRKIRGNDTSVKYGQSVLGTNYHPLTYRLSDLIASEPNANFIPSVFYWQGESLSDTTPMMTFYMSTRAYQNVVSIVQQYLSADATTATAPIPRHHRFWETLGAMAQGAMSGMAYYYTVQQPQEQAHRDAQFQSQQMTNELRQQTYQLQQIQQQLDTANSRALMESIQHDSDQYSRLLQRYSNGSW